MSNPILKHAIVNCAGMGSLPAIKAVAAHFEKVVVFDRDALPDEARALLKPHSALREPELTRRVTSITAAA